MNIKRLLCNRLHRLVTKELSILTLIIFRYDSFFPYQLGTLANHQPGALRYLYSSDTALDPHPAHFTFTINAF
jgi:hypothetical protein